MSYLESIGGAFSSQVSYGDTPPSNSPADYQPTAVADDVTAARELLFHKLPMELVDAILDKAEYWTTFYTEMMSPKNITQRRINGSFPDSGGNGNMIICRSAPIGFVKRDIDGEYWKAIDFPAPPAPGETMREADSFRATLGHTFPALIRPVRKIVFTIVSHDQGWSSEPQDPRKPYTPSWTWFDVGIERFSKTEHCKLKMDTGNCDHDLEEMRFGDGLSACSVRTMIPATRPKKDQNGVDTDELELDIPGAPNDEWTVQINRLANNNYMEHVIEWKWEDNIKPDSAEATTELVNKGRGRGTAMGKFVRRLQVGDIITLWGKARFPGWRNDVKSAKIDVFWTV